MAREAAVMLVALSAPTKQKGKRKRQISMYFKPRESKNSNKQNRRNNGWKWTRGKNFMAHMSRPHQKLGMIRRPPKPSRMKLRG